MSRWIPASKASEIPVGEGKEMVVEGQLLAIFNVAGEFFALDGVCPHQGGPLGKGKLCDGILTCPWHGWQFDVRTGQHQLSATRQQPRYAVRVADDVLLVEMP
jgi:nitrite reductase/ring-hydroxylating ferredoxin subunit